MKRLILVFSFCTFAWLGMSGCTDEKFTVCPDDPLPGENDYRLLYVYNSRDLVYTFSTKTGELLDSTRYPGDYPFWDVSFSKDGRYAYYSGYSTWIAEFTTNDTIAIASEQIARWNSLSFDEKYLLVGGYGTSVRLLELPNLNVVYQREYWSGWDNGTIHPLQNIAYVPYTVDSFLVIDFRSSSITETAVYFTRANGSPVGAGAIAVSKDGKILILSGGTRVQLRDSETFELLHEYAPGRGIPYLHPDGERVFFIEWRDDFGQRAEIWELNLKSSAMTRILTEDDVSVSYPFGNGLNPSGMDFTPDGKFAFIVNGGQGLEWGAILKMDCSTYKIVDVIAPPPSLSQSVYINPREIRGE